MAENLTQKTFKGFAWQFGGAIFQTILQLGVLFVLARLISKAEFGVVQSSLIVVGFSQLLSNLGVGPALVQMATLTPTHIRVGSTISLSLSLLFFFIVFFSSGLLADFFKMPELQTVLKVVAILFIIEGITTVSQSLLLRKMKQKTLVQIDFISYSIGYGIVAIGLSYLGFGLWSLIIGQITQSLLKCILSFIKCKHSILPRFNKKEAKQLLYFGGGFTIARLFNYLALQGDNIIAGRYLGAEALGIYSRAYAIMVKPVSLIGDSIDKALFPAMAARQNQPDKLIEAFINGSKIIAFACIPITFILIFSSKEIIHILLGSKWEDTIIPFQILTAGLFFRTGYKMGDCLSKSTGQVYSRAKRHFAYAAAVIVGCYVGSKWGLIGLSFGTLFAIIINYILMIHLSLNILKINWFYFLKRILPESSISFILSVVFISLIYTTRLIFESDILILLTSYGSFSICVVCFFYFYSHKLSFLQILPLKDTLRKTLKKRTL